MKKLKFFKIIQQQQEERRQAIKGENDQSEKRVMSILYNQITKQIGNQRIKNFSWSYVVQVPAGPGIYFIDFFILGNKYTFVYDMNKAQIKIIFPALVTLTINLRPARLSRKQRHKKNMASTNHAHDALYLLLKNDLTQTQATEFNNIMTNLKKALV